MLLAWWHPCMGPTAWRGEGCTFGPSVLPCPTQGTDEARHWLWRLCLEVYPTPVPRPPPAISWMGRKEQRAAPLPAQHVGSASSTSSTGERSAPWEKQP